MTILPVPLFAAFLALAPAQEDPQQVYRQALAKLEASDVKGALGLFQQLREAGHRDFDYYLGFCHLKLGDYEAAAERFRSASEVKPQSWQVRLGLGRALFHLGRLREAEFQFEHALALETDLVEARYHLGLIDFKQGDYQSSIEHLQQALSDDPYHLGASYNLGLAYSRLGERRKARRWIARHRELSRIHDRIEARRKAASFQSSTAENWVSLGEAYLEVADYLQAENAFRKALELSNEPELHYHLGYVAFQMGREQDAIREYRALLEERPDHYQALFGLGQALRRAGKVEQALEAFNKAARARPDDPMLRLPAAEIMLQKRDWKAGLKIARDIVRRFPDFAHGHLLKAFALNRLERNEEALEDARRAVELAPSKANYRMLLADVLQALGRHQEAQKQRQLASSEKRDPEGEIP